MPEIHAARRRRAQQLVREAGADAALITAGPNVRYLTGLASSNAALLLPADGDWALLATDSRYAGAAERDAADLDLIIERFIEGRLATEASRRGIGKLAFESHEMTVDRHGELATRLEGVATVPFGRKIEALRMVKDATELEKLRVACELSDAALAQVLPGIKAGDTERTVGFRLDAQMIALGAERTAFDTIVASGPNGAIPHHAPTDRPLQPGDLVTMDFGALYQGYHADMTRTVSIGQPPLAAGDLRPGGAGAAGRHGGAGRWRGGGGGGRRGAGRDRGGRAFGAFPARPRARRGAGDPRGPDAWVRKNG